MIHWEDKALHSFLGLGTTADSTGSRVLVEFPSIPFFRFSFSLKILLI